jgi:hypothetical protein
MNSGHHMLAQSFSGFDPTEISGRTANAAAIKRATPKITVISNPTIDPHQSAA